ncbi:hypothetical protein C0Q70_09213 [Pomacea canaliculata]|uniref:Coiled-coil domain-containing protein 148 n=1 Tax=Pomacea canaliculata TaxID=400727 RepID=A0A2T7P955_POMCA|nr:hypothetical protein C0Q70_09213 [Pomacea canaliculata]
MNSKELPAFNTSTFSGDTAQLVHRMTEGLSSNKYKPVDYNRLKALTSEKKFASIKTSMKVKKIEEISKANKESSILKQHRLIWQKEFLHLQHLRRKIQTEVESHIRSNASSDICSHIYHDFEYQEASLSSAFDRFKQDTVEPVWNLRDDLRYWLTENREDLKLGDPEVIKKHAEIKETANSVTTQQAKLLEKLQHEQLCLEQELQSEELNQLCPSLLDKHAVVQEGIPFEALDLECPDNHLKASVLQEFLILDDKYSTRLEELQARHALALKMDDNGRWSSNDHFIFVAIHDQYPRELPNRRTLLFNRLKRHLPAKTHAELSDHEDWWMDYKYLKERIKGLYSDWARDRRELLSKVKLIFQEAVLSHQLEELHSENIQRQRQYCQVQEWREKKLEAMQLEAELEEQQRKLVEERLQAEQEEERKRRLKEKKKIKAFQTEKLHQQQKLEEEIRERLEILQKELEEQAIYDHERVHYRQQQLLEKMEERKKEQERKEEEEKEKEERLEALREQVRVVAERDPARTMQDTKAWVAHHTQDEEHEYHGIYKPLFEIHSFTSKQITADPRFRLEQKLREAGLHNSSYARAVMATIEPLHPPRKDAASNIIFGNETKQ